MSTERSRGSRRSTTDGPDQLVWTEPVQSTSSPISFSTNATPTSFTLSTRRPSSPATFPGSTRAGTPPPSRPPTPGSHHRRRPANHIPRPPNAFILFRSSFIKSRHVSTEVETNHSTLSKIIGLTWKNLPTSEREIWQDRAKAAQEEHRSKFPDYTFRPMTSRKRALSVDNDDEPERKVKRRVRDPIYRDEVRCEKIAEFLVDGKTGADLDAAIQEFDKTHVPEIITRFDKPITETSFQQGRSFSARPPSSASRSSLPQSTLPPSTLPPSTKRSGKMKKQPISPPPLVLPPSDASLGDSGISSSPEFEESPFLLDFSASRACPTIHAPTPVVPYPSLPRLRLDTSQSQLSVPRSTGSSLTYSSSSSSSSSYAMSPASPSASASYSSPAISFPPSPMFTSDHLLHVQRSYSYDSDVKSDTVSQPKMEMADWPSLGDTFSQQSPMFAASEGTEGYFSFPAGSRYNPYISQYVDIPDDDDPTPTQERPGAASSSFTSASLPSQPQSPPTTFVPEDSQTPYQPLPSQAESFSYEASLPTSLRYTQESSNWNGSDDNCYTWNQPSQSTDPFRSDYSSGAVPDYPSSYYSSLCDGSTYSLPVDHPVTFTSMAESSDPCSTPFSCKDSSLSRWSEGTS